MYLITIKNKKLKSILTYIVMAVIAFITSQYILNDYKEFTKTLAIAFLILASVSFFKKTPILIKLIIKLQHIFRDRKCKHERT